MTDKVYNLGLDDEDRVATTFGGGLPKGSIVLIEGKDGAGKSVFSQRFARGFTSEGNRVTFVTPELRINGFLRQMASLGYPIIDSIVSDDLLFLWADVDTLVSDKMSDADKPEPRLLINSLVASEEPWDSDIIILDGFDALLNHDATFDSQMDEGIGDDAMQALLNKLRKHTREGKTIIMTINPEAVPENTLRPIRNIADVYFDINMRVTSSSIKRALNVKRYSEMDELVDDTISYSVQPDIGIIIETQTVV